MRSIRIVIADDHQIVRSGFRSMLSFEPGLDVVGEACDGIEAIEIVEKLKPDMLIVDLRMPGLSGFEVMRQAKQRAPATRLLAMSASDSQDDITRALQSGAIGYLLKGSDADDIIKAVRQVSEGRIFLCTELMSGAIDHYIANGSQQYPVASLSPTEREILARSAEGQSSKSIAEAVNLSIRALESTKQSLLKKLGIVSEVALVRFAIRHKLISGFEAGFGSHQIGAQLFAVQEN